MRFYLQQHRFYCGVDLHSRTMQVWVLDASGGGPQMSQCCKPRCRAVNTFVCYSLGTKRARNAMLGLMGDVPGRATFPGIGVIVKSWRKTRKNRGQSESSPSCLNAVNPAVGFSATENELPRQAP
jgi:hypothetical protein